MTAYSHLRTVEKVGPRELSTTCGATHVVLVGKAPTRDHDLPAEFPVHEIWGANAVHAYDAIRWGLSRPVGPDDIQRRATRWFQMHPVSILPHDELFTLAQVQVPVYLVEDVPQGLTTQGVLYPLTEVEGMVRTHAGMTPRFASTFDYMMGLAIYEGAARISLLGVELGMGAGRERLCEHPTLAWWIGYAQGRGIKVWWPDDGWILRHPYRYGYDYHRERAWGLSVAQSILDVPPDDGATLEAR